MQHGVAGGVFSAKPYIPPHPAFRALLPLVAGLFLWGFVGMMKIAARKVEELLLEGEPVTVTFSGGRVVAGTLWMNSTRRGQWAVEYGGRRESNGRTYQSTAEIRAAARALLREIARRPD